MATNEHLIEIPGRLHSVAIERHVAGADAIIDDAIGKTQDVINADVDNEIAQIKGGSTDSLASLKQDIDTEKSRAEGVEATKANASDVYSRAQGTAFEDQVNNTISQQNAHLNDQDDKLDNIQATVNAKQLEIGAVETDLEPIENSPNRLTSGSLYDVFGHYIESSEYVRVCIDTEGKVLWGIKTDGEVFFGTGCPQQIKDYVNEMIAQGKIDIQALLDLKEDKEEGKSLVNADFADTQSSIDSPEYLQVTTDSEDKVVNGIRKNGTYYIGGDLQVDGAILNQSIQSQIDSAVEDMHEEVEEMMESAEEILSFFEPANVPEWMQATTDSKGRVLAGRDKEGKVREFVGIDTPELNAENISVSNYLELSTNAIDKLKEDLAGGTIKHRITVATDGSGDFISIRAAIKSIADASPDNQYEIYVKNGTYNEIDIITKSYVNVVGESRDGVIIQTDGKSTAISPSDYHFSDYANTPINQIPVSYKHLLWHCSNSEVSNLTMIVNDCKYVVHQDEAAGAFVAKIKDCVVKRVEQTSCGYGNLVGAGPRHTEYYEYEGCDFITEVPDMDFRAFSTAVYAHNMANDNGECGVTIKDCNVYNCHIVNFVDLGAPAQKSYVNIDNVNVDGAFYGIRINGTDGVALTTKLDIKNCKPNFVLLGVAAAQYFKNALNPYTMSLCQVSQNVLLGQPISVNKYGTIHPVGIANSGEEFVLALEDISSRSIGYCNTGKVGLALAEAGNYSQGDDLYIYNGKFTKTVHGEKVAFVMFNKQISEAGLIEICKIK